MNDKMKHICNEVRGRLKNDEFIGARFAILNTTALVCTFVTAGSKNLPAKAVSAVVGILATYGMNQEMAKFMDAIINGERYYDLDRGYVKVDDREWGRCHVPR